MSLSFTNEYYPDLDELTPEQFAAAREKVVLSLQPLMPDVDLAPGTPTGDFVVTPLAAYRAAAEEANSRLMSDLDLSNVADGLIYSCDFVRAYLGNFAVYDVGNLKATGLVRLTYKTGVARVIPRTIRFRFGSNDDWSLRVTNPDIEEVTILAAGSEHTGDPDTYILAQTSATTWAVDVPVDSVMTAPVAAGSGGSATEVHSDLIGISAAIDFMSGLPSASLPDLAKMARKIAFSLTAGSRASTRAMVYRNWPESTMVSPVVPGDMEMQRIAPGAAMSLQAPAVDLYFRSVRDMHREVHNVRLDYVQPDAGPKVFRGVLPLFHRPSRILGVVWSGTTNESLVTSYEVYSRSSRSDLYGSLHCGTRYESSYIELVPVLDLGIPLIPLTDVVEGGDAKQYAIFTITYDTDPLLETVSSLMESPDYRPAGVDVLVKSGPLVMVDQLDITYTKKEGVKTTLSVARQRIVEYLRTAGYPDPFRINAILDIMRDAGATRVRSVAAAGTISASAATRLFRSTITDPVGDDLLADWEAESDAFTPLVFSTIDGMEPYELIDGEISPGGPPDAWAATPRTIRYFVDSANIRFIET